MKKAPNLNDLWSNDLHNHHQIIVIYVTGNLITSRGPGTSLECSLALVTHLVGQDKADEVGKAMLVN